MSQGYRTCRSTPSDRGAAQRAATTFWSITENTASFLVEHLDAHPVAETQERRRGPTVLDLLQHAALSKAPIAAGPIIVRNRAGTHDRTGPEPPRRGHVLDQARKVESHVHPGFRAPEQLAVDMGHQRQRHFAAVPGVAEYVRSHRNRREGRGRLRLVEAEALGQFRRDQVSQRPVVDGHQHQQLDVRPGHAGTRAHRHVVGDHGHFGLEIDAVRLAGRPGQSLPPSAAGMTEPPW